MTTKTTHTPGRIGKEMTMKTSERKCRCGHGESAHRWAGASGRCNTAPCRCLVYQMAPRDAAEVRDMEAQQDVLRRYGQRG